MRLVVVSGLSGAGKSIALHTLEDLGFFCTDNLPATLLPAFAEQMFGTHKGLYELVGVGIDARNPRGVLEHFPAIFAELSAKGVRCELVFLDADDPILVKRFNETRRKHPLTGEHVSLSEAIVLERERLEPLSGVADFRINTSNTNLYQLRDMVRQRLCHETDDNLSLLIQSFGFKHGAPGDADFVFDVRCLPNPYWDPKLRRYTGLDEPVAEFLAADPLVDQMYEDIRVFLENWIPRFQDGNRAYLTVAVGCTGGQHRSVYMADRLARYFQGGYGDVVIVRHREIS